MTHPEDLLADLVDGTLSEPDRAVVDAHLDTCARCREEVEAARTAVRALASLEDVPVPVGVTGRVIAEARADTDRRASRWGRVQWAAGLAAAAAIVAVVAVNLGGPSDRDAGEAARGSASTGATTQEALVAADVRLERQSDVNYDGDDGIRALAGDAYAEYTGGSEDGSDQTEGAGETPAAPAATTALGGAEADRATKVVDPAPALRCLRSDGIPPEGPPATLVRLLEARYSGTPAYLAVFLQGPGAGQEPDRVVVWTLDRETCDILNIADVPFSELD